MDTLDTRTLIHLAGRRTLGTCTLATRTLTENTQEYLLSVAVKFYPYEHRICP